MALSVGQAAIAVSFGPSKIAKESAGIYTSNWIKFNKSKSDVLGSY